MDKVVLLNSGKTKTGKTVINFGYINPNNIYKKGFELLTQYIDNPDLHDRFGVNDFGRQYEAELGYRDTYDGKAVKVINKLVNENGELIFEI